MEILLSLMIGVGLAAACGFRVFVPFLGVSIAALSGQMHLAPSMAWLGTWPALIALGTATIVEIAAFHIPVLNHALDVITAPLAVVAGTVLTATSLGDVAPLLKWTLAAIAGGGVSGLIHLSTAGIRGVTSVATAGAGGVAVAAGEGVLSIVLTVLALLLPALAVALTVYLAYRLVRRLLRAGAGKTERRGMAPPRAPP
jgi:hypothetical protein